MKSAFTHKFLPGENSTAPTLLLLHGTGGNEDSLIEIGRDLYPTAHLLSPRGKVLENGMPRYFKRLAEGVFDLEDLNYRTQELARFIAEARKAYGLEQSPIFAVGYSNGANIAVNLLLTDTSALDGAILFRALLPQKRQASSPLDHKSVLVLCGEYDSMISPDAARELEDALVKSGAKVKLHWEPTGHGLTPNDIATAKTWLAQQLHLEK